jgi:hypothetical protein
MVPMKASKENPQKTTSKIAISADNKKKLLYVSLALNGVFVATAITLAVLTNVKTFWFASVLGHAYSRTCPPQTAAKMDVHETDNAVVTTYYVSSDALESGCADALIDAAKHDDLLANPQHATDEAETFRKLVPDHKLGVTVVKSLENNTQLAPFQVKQ